MPLSRWSITIRVVLLAEDVDRNKEIDAGLFKLSASSSSRRTWIEIAHGSNSRVVYRCRPPRGGRG